MAKTKQDYYMDGRLDAKANKPRARVVWAKASWMDRAYAGGYDAGLLEMASETESQCIDIKQESQYEMAGRSEAGRIAHDLGAEKNGVRTVELALTRAGWRATVTYTNPPQVLFDGVKRKTHARKLVERSGFAIL